MKGDETFFILFLHLSSKYLPVSFILFTIVALEVIVITEALMQSKEGR